MLILSKYKDYYDFLIGIYGVDSKLILDRREYDNIPHKPYNDSKIQFIITGYIIDGFYHNGNMYYGESLKKFETFKKRRTFFLKNYNYNKDSIYIETNNNNRSKNWFNLYPIKDEKNINDKKNCPILMKIYPHKGYFHYPVLKEWNLVSILPPEKIYKMLSEWLSNKITEKEENDDKRNDVDKLESKGFDKKRSFRPKMK